MALALDSGSSHWPKTVYFIIVILIFLISWFVGQREYEATKALNLASLERSADHQAMMLQSRLVSREALALAAAAAFSPSDDGLYGHLSNIDPDLLRYTGDVFSIVWISQVRRDNRERALDVIRSARPQLAAFLDRDRTPIKNNLLPAKANVVLDIIPRTPANISSLGLVISDLPIPAQALSIAAASRQVAATAPLTLVQLPGEYAILFYVPVRRGANGQHQGFLGFSYRVKTLLSGIQKSENARLISLRDAGLSGAGNLLGTEIQESTNPFYIQRRITFGQRSWIAKFAADQALLSFQNSALVRGVLSGIATWFLLAAITGFALYLADRNRKLLQANEAHERAEARLDALARELAHRVKNAYSVALSLANQTFGAKEQSPEMFELFGGRMQALARAADLLMHSQAVATLASIISDSDMPFRERIIVEGCDYKLTSDSAQSFNLLIYELWTNAVKHGALADPNGLVNVSCRREGDQIVFAWKEITNAPKQANRTLSKDNGGFGSKLILSIVPSQLSGQASVVYNMTGLIYTLILPATGLELSDPAMIGA